jgi:hypothetical protein
MEWASGRPGGAGPRDQAPSLWAFVSDVVSNALSIQERSAPRSFETLNGSRRRRSSPLPS